MRRNLTFVTGEGIDILPDLPRMIFALPTVTQPINQH